VDLWTYPFWGELRRTRPQIIEKWQQPAQLMHGAHARKIRATGSKSVIELSAESEEMFPAGPR
jgi:hypothetical protein